MGLEQLNFERQNKVEFAISLLQAWEPSEGYYLAFSGGKDSVAIYDLAVKAGVKFDAHYCVSPIDPKEIHDFIKQNYPDVQWDYHARGFWNTVVREGLPLRQARWCCRIIKEAGGDNRVVIVGNRRAEGANRSKQCFVATPEQRAEVRRKRGLKSVITNKTFVRPIINFSDFDIWQYIRDNNLPYCSLYDEGTTVKGYGVGIFKRLGCVLCPFKKNRLDIAREIEYFPKITKLWLMACNRITEAEKARGYKTLTGKPVRNKFETGQERFVWWIKRE